MSFSLVSLKASEENRELLGKIEELWRECFEEDTRYTPKFDMIVTDFIAGEHCFYTLGNERGEILASVEYSEEGDSMSISNLCTKDRRKEYGYLLLDHMKSLGKKIYVESWIWKGEEDDTGSFYLENGFEESCRYCIDDENVEEVIEYVWRVK